MSRQKNRGRPSTAAPSISDQARDELFQHIMRCGVIGSAPEHQTEWFDETMKVMAERWHELSPKQVADLRVLGERFAAPATRNAAPAAADAPSEPALNAEDEESEEGALDAANAA
jgi:hypothetical protein